MATNTATTFTNHTGNGTAGPFNISFSYIEESEVDVTVGGVLKTITTHYTFTSATQITFTSGNEPANGAAIKFQRDTDITAKKVDFVDGSVLTEADLDANSNQILFAQQEIMDNFVKRDGTQTLVNNLVFEGSTSDGNETTLAITDPTADRTITLPDTTGTVVTTGDTGTVTSTMINDGTIVNADINASAAIAQSKLNIANATTSAAGYQSAADKTKLDGIETNATADQTVAEIKNLLASSPLDSSHLAANSVGSSQLASNAVVASAIGPDSITSAMIPDSQIGKEHLKDNSVGSGELIDNQVLFSKLNDALVVTNSEQSGISVNDTSFFTTSASDARYLGTFAQLTGNTFTGNNIHNDNVKAIFGTSSDGLEIFHNSSDSIINDSGTGSLKLQTGGNTKFEVTDTGANVTGTINIGDATNTAHFIKRITGATNTNCGLELNSGGSLNLVTGTSTAFVRLSISATGDIQFGTLAGTSRLFLEDVITHAGDTDTHFGFSPHTTSAGAQNLFEVMTGGTIRLLIDNTNTTVTGNIVVSGTVDGVDIAARDTLFGGLTSSSGALTDGVTATTQSASDNSTKVATTAYTDTAIANLVDSSPSALNTLNELAAALGDDANFSTTVTNSIATKLPLAGGTLTGSLGIGTSSSAKILHLASNANAQTTATIPGIRIENTDTTATANNVTGEIEFFSKDASEVDKISGFIKNVAEDAGTKYGLTFGSKTSGSNATERVRIDSSGQVGIGTSSPNTKLDVRDGSATGISSRSTSTQTTDTNKGLRVRNNSDTDTFSVSYKGQGYFASNLGIGTTSPQAELVIRGSTPQVVLEPTSDAQNCRFQFATTDGTIQSSIMGGGSDGAVIKFLQGFTERMRIDSSGQVGIGTTSPDSLLEVVSTASNGINAHIGGTKNNDNQAAVRRIEFGTTNFRNFIQSQQGSGGSSFSSDNDLLLNPNGGDIGIGTTSPARKLHLNESGTGTAVYASFTNGTTGVAANNGLAIGIDGSQNAILNNYSNTDIVVLCNGAERLRVDSSGQVGIGTSSPSKTLDIVGGEIRGHSNLSASHFNLRLKGQDTNTGGAIIAENSAGNAGPLLFFTGGSNQAMTLDSSGRLLVGNTTGGSMNAAADNLVVGSGTGHNGMTIFSAADGDGWIVFNDAANTTLTGAINYNHTNNNFAFYTNSSERVRIDSSGRLGIGTSSPSEKLNVSGNILATGTITPNSDIAFKKDIKPLTNVLNKVTQLLGINFTYKNNNEKSMGLVAQDVEKVFPELVRGEEGNKSLNYMGLTGALIEAIKELSAKVEALEAA